MTEQPSKASKIGHVGVLWSKSSNCCIIVKKIITRPDCQEEQQRMTKYKCFQSLLLVTIMGAQWLIDRVLDLRPRGPGLEPHRRHYVVSFNKTH